MTVNTTTITSGPFEGNDVADEFSYTFRIDDKTQVKVIETDSAGVETVLTVDTDYTVAGIGNDAGGIITRVAGALPTNSTWFIRSDYKQTQLSALPSQGPFFPDIHESAFDKLTFLVQQLEDVAQRSFRLSSNIDIDGVFTIPDDASSRASKYLAFDGNGDLITATDPGSLPSSSEVDLSGTVAAMQLKSLDAGVTAVTQGRTTAGDGGGETYLVVAGNSSDTFNRILLANGNTAVGQSSAAHLSKYGGNTDVDDTAAFQSAADKGGVIRVTQNCKIVGEVIFGSNTAVLVDDGVLITVDASGENGRGLYFKEAINSGIVGNFTIAASATSVSTDGSKNSCIQFGNDTWDVSPSITRDCFVHGNIQIEISGTLNVKGVYGSGWVEYCVVDGVSVTGKTNFAITTHWTGDNDSGIQTKTWHAHNLTVRNCRVWQKAGFDKPLRGFTFSASGRVDMQDCSSDTTTLNYNPFIGDYGYTYAQNITQDEAADFHFRNLITAGAGGTISCDMVSSGLNGSPVWNGTDHNATLIIDGIKGDGSTHATGLLIGLTKVEKVSLRNLDLVSTDATATREWIKADSCGDIHIHGKVIHQKWLRLLSCNLAEVVCDLRADTLTPDVTSARIVVEGGGKVRVHDGHLHGTRTGIDVTAATDQVDVYDNTFEQIGSALIDFDQASGGSFVNNHVVDCGTETVSTPNIFGVLINNGVGISVHGNRFSTNGWRYIVVTHAGSANINIFGNRFEDLNFGAVSPRAVFVNGASTNVSTDVNTNLVSNGVILI